MRKVWCDKNQRERNIGRNILTEKQFTRQINRETKIVTRQTGRQVEKVTRQLDRQTWSAATQEDQTQNRQIRQFTSSDLAPNEASAKPSRGQLSHSNLTDGYETKTSENVCLLRKRRHKPHCRKLNDTE